MKFFITSFLCVFCIAFAKANDKQIISNPNNITIIPSPHALKPANSTDISVFKAPDLIEAIIANDIIKVGQILTEGNIDLNARYYMEGTPERQRIAIENIGTIQSVRDAGMARFFASSPLEYAVTINHAEIARLLIKAGAEVNKPDSTGYTPLHWAAITLSKEAVIVLLSAGADPNARDNLLMTPHQVTTDQEIARILKKSGAGNPFQRLINIGNSCRRFLRDIAVGL